MMSRAAESRPTLLTQRLSVRHLKKAPNNSFVMTAYLGAGTTGDRSFPKGCISLTGTVSSVAHDMAADAEIPDLLVGTRLDITVSEGVSILHTEHQRV